MCPLSPILFLLALAASALSAETEVRNISGWNVHIRPELWEKLKPETDTALKILQGQLEEIIRVVPAPAVAQLQKIPLWFSPEYPSVQGRAEYHPDGGWLRENGRDPVMAKAVEFTDIRAYEVETRRMPNFPLHELAHGYHDRFLPGGFDHAEIKAAYEAARDSGKYDKVQRRNAAGEVSLDRAYAMTNQQEYFAECTEAYFSTNDFFPFTKDELAKHDPRMVEVLGKVWGVTASRVTAPPAEMKLPPF